MEKSERKAETDRFRLVFIEIRSCVNGPLLTYLLTSMTILAAGATLPNKLPALARLGSLALLSGVAPAELPGDDDNMLAEGELERAPGHDDAKFAL